MTSLLWIYRKLTRKEHFELNDLRHKGAKLPSSKQFGKDHLAEVSWRGFHRTGLCCDISQVTRGKGQCSTSVGFNF